MTSYFLTNKMNLVSLFFRRIFLEKFYFLKTVRISVYGNIAVSAYKIDYTLRCLEYIRSVSSHLRRHGIVKALTNVL